MATILVVDDHVRDREYLVALLNYAGHQVLQAEDGMDALATLLADAPELVIADVLMPTVDGFELVRRIREHPDKGNTRVLLYTAAYDEKAARSFFGQSACTTVLPKPSEPQVILRTIERLLQECPRTVPRVSDDFDSKHRELLTTKLHQKVIDLERARDELAAREAELRIITNAVPVLISFLDADQRFRFANEQHEQWFGWTPGDLLGRSLAEVLGPDDYAAIRHYAERALDGETVVFKASLTLGGKRYVRTTFVSRGKGVGFIALIEDLTDLRNSELALRETNAALQSSNTRLNQFAHATAHDLREPSRQVALFAALLARSANPKLDEQEKEYLEYCEAGARRMAALVAGLLSFTSLEGFQAGEAIEPVDANDIVTQVLADLRTKVREAEARIICGHLPNLRIPSTHLTQLFSNLIGNALKFRHPERTPEISVFVNEGQFSIQDNGIGIAAEDCGRAFELFHRLNGFQYEGTGLGLALCSRIVERYGGRIWVESELDRGSTFHFTLPMALLEG